MSFRIHIDGGVDLEAIQCFPEKPPEKPTVADVRESMKKSARSPGDLIDEWNLPVVISVNGEEVWRS